MIVISLLAQIPIYLVSGLILGFNTAPLIVGAALFLAVISISINTLILIGVITDREFPVSITLNLIRRVKNNIKAKLGIN